MRDSLATSFKIQSRVIGALLMREVLTRYGRHNIGFMWLFVEPMLFTLGITALWSLVAHHQTTDISIQAFALTGYSTVLLWRNAVNRCNLAIQPNLCLMYHRNVKVIDVFLSRLILETIGATVSLIVLSFIFISLGLAPIPDDILTMAIGWVLLIWFAVGLGFLIGSLSERSELIDRIWHVFTYLLFGVSGAGFMVSWLPDKFQELVLWLPMVNCTELIRKGYFGGNHHYYYDIPYVITFNLCLLFIGLALVRDIGRRIEPE